jgi:hypothetical protein
MTGPGNGQNSNTGSDQNQGNATAPNGPPSRDFRNMTGNMTMPGPGNGNMNGHGLGNMTEGNTTFTIPPPWDSNMTAGNWTPSDNTTMRQHGEGNLTMQKPQDGNVTPPQANGNTNGAQGQNGNNAGTGSQSGQQQGSVTQAQSTQDQKDSDLISAFLKWLKGQ